MKKMIKTKSTTTSKALSLAPLSSYVLGELKSIIYLCSAIRGNVQVQDRSAIGVEEYIEKIYTIKHRGDWGREAPKISCT